MILGGTTQLKPVPTQLSQLLLEPISPLSLSYHRSNQFLIRPLDAQTHHVNEPRATDAVMVISLGYVITCKSGAPSALAS